MKSQNVDPALKTPNYLARRARAGILAAAIAVGSGALIESGDNPKTQSSPYTYNQVAGFPKVPVVATEGDTLSNMIVQVNGGMENPVELNQFEQEVATKIPGGNPDAITPGQTYEIPDAALGSVERPS